MDADTEFSADIIVVPTRKTPVDGSDCLKIFFLICQGKGTIILMNRLTEHCVFARENEALDRQSASTFLRCRIARTLYVSFLRTPLKQTEINANSQNL